MTLGQEAFKLMFGWIIAFKAFHYRTSQYGKHKELDNAFSKFEKHVDRFLETWQGKHQKIVFCKSRSSSGHTCTDIMMTVPILDRKNYRSVIDGWIGWLDTDLPKYLHSQKDSDLLNIRDDIKGDLNRLKYLLDFD
jgi:hypothetical protein